MKTISFPVGYRVNYLEAFLDTLKMQNLEGYNIFCSAENCKPCIDKLKNCGLNINILMKPNSSGVKSHEGARRNMFNALSAAFASGSDFNVHLEDDLLLAPDALDLANWYYENFKAKPTTYMSYGLFSFSPRGEDYTLLEEAPYFEGLGWCAFKEGWNTCFKAAWFDDKLALRNGAGYGWDWAVQGFFKENKCKSLRPLINRTQHNGRMDGTCCTLLHHDTHYVPLKWNKSERVVEFKVNGQSDETKEWIK